MTSFNMESLINAPPCFPSEKPPCIDLILTNKKTFVQKFQKVQSWDIRSPPKFITNEKSIYSGQPKDRILPRL